MNDTVVVYDRIRENLRKYKQMNIYELINQSLNETMSRTLLTSVTTLLALFSLYFLGGGFTRFYISYDNRCFYWYIFVYFYRFTNDFIFKCKERLVKKLIY